MDGREIGGKRVLLVTSFTLAAFAGWAVAFQSLAASRIEHDALSCINTEEFPLVAAEISAPSDGAIERARLYFKAHHETQWSFLEMEPGVTKVLSGHGNILTYQAPLLEPLYETEKVDYYIEVIDSNLATARSEEYLVEVRPGECKDVPVAPAAMTAAIVVHATVSGQSAVPTGFSAQGVSGFVTASGQNVLAGEASDSNGGGGAVAGLGDGGGLSGKTIGIVAGGGAAAALALAASGGGETTTTPTVTTTTTSSSSTTTTTTTTTTSTTATTLFPGMLQACFDIKPSERVDTGTKVTFDGSCSTPQESISEYRWTLQGIGSRTGRVVTATYQQEGEFNVALTVRDGSGETSKTTRLLTVTPPGTTPTTTTTTTTTPTTSSTTTTTPTTTTTAPTTTTTTTTTTSTSTTIPVTACFDCSDLVPPDCANCGLRLDASCSSGPIVSYNWVFETSGGTGSGKVIALCYGASTCGTPQRFRLTVRTASGSSDSQTGTCDAPAAAVPLSSSLQTSFTSSLEATDGEGVYTGRVSVNGSRQFRVNSRAPVSHSFTGLHGKNRVEAFSTSQRGGERFWRFDFSGSQHFAPGSLKIELGQVLASDAFSVVFRMSGEAGERVKFTYKLSP